MTAQSNTDSRVGFMKIMVKDPLKVPRYLEIADQLREQVQGGQLKPGDQLPSLVEMRMQYSISRGTVEKVHSLLEQDGLIVREQGRGVFVARLNQQVRHGVIGFIAGGFSEVQSSYYWAHLVAGIREAAAKEKFQVLLLNKDADESAWKKIDGLLVAENEDVLAVTLNKLPESLPRLSLMTPWPDVNCVLADDHQGAFLATKHLLDLGHRNIGHLVAGHNHLIDNRLAGYREAMREVGVEPKLGWVRQLRMRPNQVSSKREYVEQGRRTIQEWLRTDWQEMDCTAVLAQNDHAAIGAIEAFQEAGLRVPENVSVVGFDGTEAYEFFKPRLTTIEIPLFQIGEDAMLRLLNHLDGGNGHPSHTKLPTRLCIGESTGPCPS